MPKPPDAYYIRPNMATHVAEKHTVMIPNLSAKVECGTSCSSATLGEYPDIPGMNVAIMGVSWSRDTTHLSTLNRIPGIAVVSPVRKRFSWTFLTRFKGRRNTPNPHYGTASL